MILSLRPAVPALVVAVLAAALMHVDGAQAQAGPADTVQVLVTLQPQTSGPGPAATGAAQAEFLAGTDVPLEDVRELSALPAVVAEVNEADLDALRADPNVADVTESIPVSVMMAEGKSLIGAAEASARGHTGAGITVAVLDTGVDAQHAALAGAVVLEKCFISDETCSGGAQSGAGTARDVHGHGTAVAGIVASRGGAGVEPGVAPGASIAAYRVLQDGGTGLFGDILAALDDILVNQPEVDIVNMSLGTTIGFASCDAIDALHTAMAETVGALRARGTLVVAASGNSALTDALASPACLTGVISVGAVYDADMASGGSYGAPASCTDPERLADHVTCYSNSAPALDVLAPSNCTSTTSTGGGVYACLGGTSAATPYVSGSLALFLSAGAGAPLAEAFLGYGPAITDTRDATGGRQTPRLDVRGPIAALAVDPAASTASAPADPTAPANGVSTETVTVALLDGAGSPVSGVPAVAFSVAVSSGGAPSADTTTGAVAETATPGTYAFTVASRAAGAFDAAVSVAGVPLAATASLGFVPSVIDAAASTVTPGATEGVPADGSAASTVTVEVRDQAGPVSGLAADLAVTVDGSAVASAPVESSTPGRYTFEVRDTVAETVTVSVTAAGVPLDSAPTIAFVMPPAPPPAPPSGGGGGFGGGFVPPPVATPAATPTPRPDVVDEPGNVRVTLEERTKGEVRTGAALVLETTAGGGAAAAVTVPSGALPPGATVRLGAVADAGDLLKQAPMPASMRMLAPFHVDATDARGNALTRDFATPVTIEFTLTASALAGVDAASLTVAFWDGEEWVEVAATVERHADGSMTLTTRTEHFTIFAVARRPGFRTFTGTLAAQGSTLTMWGGGPIADAAGHRGVRSLWAWHDGAPRGYIVGAPDFANASFRDLYADDYMPAGTLVLVVTRR